MARAKVKNRDQQNAGMRYLREVRSEMSKVIWPSREQAVNLTVIVIVVMIGMGLFLGASDTIFGLMLELLVS